MQLRPYQSAMLDDLRSALRPKESGGLGHRRVCVVLPTGGGKTVIFSAMARGAADRGRRVWAVAHREELIWQMSEKFSMFGVRHGVIKSGYPEAPALIQAAMIQTLKNRLARHQPPDVLIVDECHHTPSKTYTELLKLLPPTTQVIGFTATPERLDGKGLGTTYSHMVQGPSIQELIGLGFLVPPVVYAPPTVDTSALHTRMGDFVRAESEDLLDKPRITGDIIEHYKKLANGLSAVAFCTTVAHAEHVASQFVAAGIPAASVDGRMSKDARKNTLDAFRQGRVLVLTSCDLISEGFDLPKIECVILARPTKSLSLYLQQVGRGLRTDDGKTRALILDHVENTSRFGLPDDDRDWFLYGDDSEDKKSNTGGLKVKTCPDCFRCYTTRVCPCGSEASDRSIDIEHVEGELVQVSFRKSVLKPEYEQLKTASSIEEIKVLCAAMSFEFTSAKNLLINTAASLPELRHVGRIFGYAHRWAEHRYQGRHGAEALQEALVEEMKLRRTSA